MKKLLLTLSVFTVATTITANLASSYIGISNPSVYLRSLPDFDWRSEFGDRMSFMDYQGHTIKEQEEHAINRGIVNPHFDNDVIDYLNFNTGYQSGQAQTNSIAKQGITGAPTSKIFMPNGNIAKDFGVNDRATRFTSLNSFLTWNPEVDMDAKFNRVSPNNNWKTRSARELTASKWVQSQSPDVRHSYLGFSSIGHRSPVSTGIGQKNPWNNSFTSYQYLDRFVDWGGSFFEGIIKIPSADAIEAAHKNGSKSYATIFLDGYHGLTKNMLRDFLKKDNHGNFFISKILLDMADYFGFDGFFWNNESNGGLPNGTIVDYHDIIEIFKQMDVLKKTYDNPIVQNLQQTFYSSYARLTYNSMQNPHNLETFEMTRYADEIGLDFGQNPEELEDFLRNRPDWRKRRLEIYNIIELAATSLHGFFDTRFLTSGWRDENGQPYSYGTNKWTNDNRNRFLNDRSKNNTMTFDNEILSSISFFEDNGSAAYGIDAIQALRNLETWKKYVQENKNKGWEPHEEELYENLFAQQVTNIMEEALYTGRNRFLRIPATYADPTKDKTHRYDGKILWENKTDLTPEDLKINTIVNEDYGITNNGWNSQWNKMSRINVVQAMDVIPDLGINLYGENLTDDQKRWLFAKDINDNYVYSFGAGSLIQEKTVLNSQNLKNQNWDFNTNFSTGSGIFFKDKNDYLWKNYPWSDKRMVDVTPTYRWDVRDLADEDLNSPVTLKYLSNFSQNEVSGFFDYFNIYEKGNSIALGKGINYDGSLKGINFTKPILWNIMGTNFSPNELKERQIKLALQANEAKNWRTDHKLLELKNLAEVKLAVSTINDSNEEKVYFLPLQSSSSTEHQDWTNYTISGEQIKELLPSNVQIAKLGLAINPLTPTNDIIFNVGSLEINHLEPKEILKAKEIDLNVEYLIDRKNYLNLRLNWNGIDLDEVKYFEIYYLDDNHKFFRLGETTNTSYFVKNLKQSQIIKIGIKPIYEKGANNEIYEFEIQRNN